MEQSQWVNIFVSKCEFTDSFYGFVTKTAGSHEGELAIGFLKGFEFENWITELAFHPQK